jgi:thiamine biosynthesis protein ThiS
VPKAVVGVHDRESRHCGKHSPLATILLVKLQINGEPKMYDVALSLAALISQMGLKPDRVAVELNREIVPRDQWAQTNLADGDRLEIVHFVGGGI